MIVLTIAFALSLLVTFLVLRFRHLHECVTSDHDIKGVQKFHKNPVPRIGGVGLIVGLLAAFGFRYFQGYQVGELGLLLLVSCMPAFCVGLIEDLTKRVGVRLRLLATMVSACLAGYLLGAWLSSVQTFGIDNLLMAYPWFAVILTCFAVAGVANAFNIIDGFNGLSGMVGVLVLCGLAYVAFRLHDAEIMIAGIAMVGALLGFLLFNYPRGLIFLGDGGAYLIGFWIAELSVLITTRHPVVSKWFPLLLCAYPICETLFTIYRRMIIHQSHPALPDASHLHQLIYKRMVRWCVGSRKSGDVLIRNSLTAPYLWGLTSMAVIPAILFWDDAWLLRGFMLLFAMTYFCLYRLLVRFKTPKWMTIRGPRSLHKTHEIP